MKNICYIKCNWLLLNKFCFLNTLIILRAQLFVNSRHKHSEHSCCLTVVTCLSQLLNSRSLYEERVRYANNETD